MTYSALTTSQHSAKPVQLFDVVIGSRTFNYTNAEELINVGGTIYYPQAISTPTGFKRVADASKSNATIQILHDSELANLLKFGAPANNMTITIYEGHIDDTEWLTAWVGTIINYKQALPWVELETENSYSALNKSVSPPLYSSTCSTQLYSRRCKVNKAAHRLFGTVSAKSGLTITCPELAIRAAGWFTGGFIEYTNAEFSATLTAHIAESNGAVLTLSAINPFLLVGASVAVYPNCNKLFFGDCSGKFNNTINFRGLPYQDGANPFDGTRIY